MRVADVVGWLAGDEFTIVLEGLGWPEEAKIVAQKILDATSVPVELADGPILLSTSIGVVAYGDEDTSPAQLLYRAGELLYEAKGAGHGTYRLSSR